MSRSNLLRYDFSDEPGNLYKSPVFQGNPQMEELPKSTLLVASGIVYQEFPIATKLFHEPLAQRRHHL
jgi:hypothetical protein